MENCFVQKMKGTLDNINLPLFGAIKLKVLNSTVSGRAFRIVTGVNCTLECVGSVRFDGGASQLSITRGTFTDVNLTTGDGYVAIPLRYKDITSLIAISNVEIDTDDFKYNDSLRNFEILTPSVSNYIVKGDVINLISGGGSLITAFNVNNQVGLYGNFNDFLVMNLNHLSSDVEFPVRIIGTNILFNNTKNFSGGVLYIQFSKTNSTITVREGVTSSGTVKATYANGAWSYPNT